MQKRNKQRFKSWTPAFSLGAALIGVSLGWAQDGQPASEGSVTSDAERAAVSMPEVVVSGDRPYNREKVSSPKYTEPLREIPQTITIIPKELIQDQGATSLRQVLRNVPGISMQAGEGGVPAGDNLTIRGFNARTDFYIDGMRDLGGYFRDPFNVEQVEVTKGPSSSINGRGSTGGSINQVSKYPIIDRFADVSLGIGSDRYKRGTVDLNQPIEGKPGTAVRLNAVWHDADVPGRDAVTDKRWGFAPSIAFGLGTPTRLTLGYYKLSSDSIPDYGQPFVPETNNALIGDRGRPAPVDSDNFYGLTTRDYERTDSDVFSAEVEHDFNESLSIRNLSRAGETTRDSVITAPRFVNDNTTNLNRQLQSRDQTDEMTANQTDLTARFNTGFIGHAVVVGMEFMEENQLNFLRTGATAPTADLFNPNPDTPFNPLVGRNGTKNEAEADSMSFYGFDTVKLGEKWDIPVGVRWESFGVKFSSQTNGLSPVKFERVDKMLSGNAAIVFKPTTTGSIYAGYGTSFNPSAEGLTSGFTAALAQLEPEKSKSFELGTKWDIMRRFLSVSTALFRTEKTNARTPGINPGDPPTVLDGEQRVDGVEFGLAGNLTRAWQFFGGYTYLDGEIIKSNTAAEVGKVTTNTPKNSFSVWTTYTFPTNLAIGGGMQYVGKRFANATNTREVPGYMTFDAMASMPVTDSVNVRLNGYNLADKEYYDRLGGGHVIPGMGRSVTLTTDIKFGPKAETH